MDKIAKRNKHRRKVQKEKEIHADMMRVYDEVKQYHDSHAGGKFTLSPKQVYSMHLEIDKKLFKDAMVRSLLAVVYAMNKDFGYGKCKRIDEVIAAIHWSLRTIGNEERTNKQFQSELKQELDIDAAKYIENKFCVIIKTKIPDGFKNKEKCMKRSAIAEKVTSTMNIVLYAIYFKVGFRARRMMRLLELSTEYLYDIIKNDAYAKYEQELIKRADLKICSDGIIYEHWSYLGKT